ncbi:MAG: hypothetical protein ACPG77_07660 [Nannocystaceae bacterium]
MTIFDFSTKVISVVNQRSPSICIALAALLSSACTSGDGTVEVRVYGESFVEDGIPAAAMDDGWEVQFDRFTVEVLDVTIAGVQAADLSPVDLTEPSDGAGHLLASVQAVAGTYSDATFTVGRIEVSGLATKAGTSKSFTWQFEQPTRYLGCEADVSVLDGASSTFELTIHADHLFYDSLVASEPQLLFQALADADQNNDGTIAWEELEQTGIGAYDPGNTGVANLATWLQAHVTTLGHVNGEGHCESTPG